MKKETELRIYAIALIFFFEDQARVAWEAWLAPTIVNYHGNV